MKETFQPCHRCHKQRMISFGVFLFQTTCTSHEVFEAHWRRKIVDFFYSSTGNKSSTIFRRNLASFKNLFAHKGREQFRGSNKSQTLLSNRGNSFFFGIVNLNPKFVCNIRRKFSSVFRSVSQPNFVNVTPLIANWTTIFDPVRIISSFLPKRWRKFSLPFDQLIDLWMKCI